MVTTGEFTLYIVWEHPVNSCLRFRPTFILAVSSVHCWFYSLTQLQASFDRQVHIACGFPKARDCIERPVLWKENGLNIRVYERGVGRFYFSPQNRGTIWSTTSTWLDNDLRQIRWSSAEVANPSIAIDVSISKTFLVDLQFFFFLNTEKNI